MCLWEAESAWLGGWPTGHMRRGIVLEGGSMPSILGVQSTQGTHALK
jgi:hypothetical protein